MRFLFHSVARSAAMRRASLPLALATLGACSDDVGRHASPTSPGPAPTLARGGNGNNNGRILFTSNRDDAGFDIYSMNADGTGVSRLTSSPGFDGFASFSPDGKKVVFQSTRDELQGEIYVMNADGTAVTRLTYSAGADITPAWSKDGKKIAFASTRGSAIPETDDEDALDIFVMNADGSGVTRLTNRAGEDARPSWSADGKQIAFVSDRDNSPLAQDIYVMSATDGSLVTRVTFLDTVDPIHVSWSPGGKQLAFSTDQVFVVNADGTQLTQLTWGPTTKLAPSWSSDAKQIAFYALEALGAELYTMSADGSQITRLTYSAAVDMLPAWQR